MGISCKQRLAVGALTTVLCVTLAISGGCCKKPASEEAESEDVPYTSTGAVCMWGPENECPILKAREAGWEAELTADQCMVCQLIQIKNMLQNR